MTRTYGYARVSTDDQDLTLQIQALEAHGVDHIYSEHASGKTIKRKRFELVLKMMRRGDTLVVWKLDRLGRSLSDLVSVIERMDKDGYNLVVLTEPINTTTPTGKLVFHFMAAMAQWERDMIAERTKAGMAAAKAAGKRFGRKPLIWKGDRGSVRRIAYLQEMDDKGQLRDSDGELYQSAQALADALNLKKNRDKDDLEIENPETVRRWKRQGFDGLRNKERL